jgi:hypothetical protein
MKQSQGFINDVQIDQKPKCRWKILAGMAGLSLAKHPLMRTNMSDAL